MDQIRAFSNFKNNLVDQIIKYFRSHKITNYQKIKRIRYQIYNHFINWYFQLNGLNQCHDFLPTRAFEVQANLDYILDQNQVKKLYDFNSSCLIFNPSQIKPVNQILSISKTKQNNGQIEYQIKSSTGKTWKLLPLTEAQEKRLFKLNPIPTHQIIILLLRYKFLGGINNHLSLPPKLIERLQITCELFGTPFNTTTSYYCSPFPKYEKPLGSLGSFFDYQLTSNQIYLANPPFDQKIIQLLTDKLLESLPFLQQTTIYLTIPNWQDNFPSLQRLITSEFTRGHSKLEREIFPYYHHFRDVLISVCDTYLIILSSHPDDFYLSSEEVKSLWRKK